MTPASGTLMKLAVDFSMEHGVDSEDVPTLHDLLLKVRRDALKEAKRAIVALEREVDP